MHRRLTELRVRRAAGDGGFTLIELLVVVVIIGTLVAIAIPVYLNCQEGTKNKSAASDLRGAITALEQCNSDNSTYPSALPAVNAANTAYVLTSTRGCTGQVINVSAGSSLIYSVAGPAGAYEIWSTKTGGSGKYYYSQFGGPVKTMSTAFSATVASVGSAC